MTITQVFTDSFTEASVDTVLTSHTPDTGIGWVASSFNATGTAATVYATDDTLIQPFYSASTNKFYWISVSQAQANLQRAKWTLGSATGPRAWPLMVQLQDGGTGVNGYGVYFSSGSNTWLLRRWDNGVPTTLKSYFDAGGWSAGEYLQIDIDASGNITVNHNGTALTSLDATDTTYTGGYPGIGTLKTVSSGGPDNFEGWLDVTAGGVTIPVFYHHLQSQGIA